MKPVLVLSACLLCPALALQPGVPDPKPTFERYGTDSETGIPVWRFDWTGTNGWTYFIQWSDDLVYWQYFPVIDLGATHDPFDNETDASKHFLRLRFTNIPTVDPELADFDGDGLSNIDEVATYHTDPFDPDTDHDGTNDGMDTAPLDPETGGNPLFATDSDGDGISDAAEALRGTSPLLADSHLWYMDMGLKNLCQELGIALYTVDPCLIQHVGDVSVAVEGRAPLRNLYFRPD